jgi:SAM-dependent methyltransferase
MIYIGKTEQEWVMEEKKYLSIVALCEDYLANYGDSYLGVGWTKKKDYADLRYRIMLEMIRSNGSDPVSLLDFGCGASHLYEYILQHRLDHIQYNGLDLSEKFLTLSRNKFPHISYYHLDILSPQIDLPVFDYIVLNGMFNSKGTHSSAEMIDYYQAVVRKVFQSARVGIAFNVMSKLVDWERDDLFHLPFDTLASFLEKSLSRHFIIRHDYGLFEYTVYVYHQGLHDETNN